MRRPLEPPSLSAHPSGRFWGRPPPARRTEPLTLRPNSASAKASAQPTRSICDTIEETDISSILRDLCFWQSYVSTISELRNKITGAVWYPLILLKLAETTGILSGAPNSGKSSLVVAIAESLGLSKVKTTSKNFWLYARSSRPYFSMWLYCTDSFWSESEPAWSRMAQSIHSVTTSEEFQSGALFIEGHRIFEYEPYGELCTSLFYLASSDQLMEKRGTCKESVRKHKLHVAKHLDALQEIQGLILLDAEQTKVNLVCKVLQVLLLDDAGLDSSHLRGDFDLDARWLF
eukprot:s1608_g11.t1